MIRKRRMADAPFSGESHEGRMGHEDFVGSAQGKVSLSEGYRKFRLEKMFLFIGENLSIFIAAFIFLILFIGVVISMVLLIIKKELGYVDRFIEHSFSLLMYIGGYICGKHIRMQKIKDE